MGDMGKKRTGEDKIWEIRGRREQGRTEYGRYGEWGGEGDMEREQAIRKKGVGVGGGEGRQFRGDASQIGGPTSLYLLLNEWETGV
jgi:hypothetical protein